MKASIFQGTMSISGFYVFECEHGECVARPLSFGRAIHFNFQKWSACLWFLNCKTESKVLPYNN